MSGLAEPSISEIGSTDLQAHWPSVYRVYRLAFGETVEAGGGDWAWDPFATTLRRHAHREGFRFLAATDPGGEIVAFVYGYRGGPGQWWWEHVAPALSPAAVERWLTDYLEVVELAVSPEWQRRGIGGRLHDMLLYGPGPGERACRTAALSTLDRESPARQMYRRRGWVDLLRDFQFPGTHRRFAILALDLQAALPRSVGTAHE